MIGGKSMLRNKKYDNLDDWEKLGVAREIVEEVAVKFRIDGKVKIGNMLIKAVNIIGKVILEYCKN